MSELLFFIALLPNEEIQEEVTSFKKYLAEQFEASHALRSPPHITLFPPFKWQSDRVDDLLATLNDFATQINGFSLSLHDFNCFPPRVIYVDVEKKEALLQLQERLEHFLAAQLQLKNDRAYQGFHPHLTIAHKDLKPALFPAAWAYFSKQTYQRDFLVSFITLLQFSNGRWEVYKNYPFY